MFNNPAQIMKVLKSDNGVKQMLKEQQGDFSFAELIADSINIQRMDIKRLAEIHGADVEIERMSPDYAAEMLQEGVEGDPSKLVEVFNEMEDQREEILSQDLSQSELIDYRDKKKKM